MPRPESSKAIATFAECRIEVDRLLAEKKELHRNLNAMESITRDRRLEAEELKKEKRQLVRKMDVISRKQSAQEKLKSTAGWSGCAIGCVTLTWQAMQHYGSPLPPFLMESEIFYGAVCWVATTTFAWVARSYYEAS
tara:strand:+ start:167 stop:577 length:411 start_codon:yes stop_codon:yes gene_type:complete